MIAGWKYALEKFPEVKFFNLYMKELSLSPTRSIQTELLLLAPAGVDMLSSTFITLDTPRCALTFICSWIQGHPEFGFGFKVKMAIDSYLYAL